MVIDDFHHGPVEHDGKVFRVNKVDGRVDSWYRYSNGTGCWVVEPFSEHQVIQKLAGYTPEPEWRPSWI